MTRTRTRTRTRAQQLALARNWVVCMMSRGQRKVHEDIFNGKGTMGDRENELKLNRAINVKKASARVIIALLEFEEAVDKRWRSLR